MTVEAAIGQKAELYGLSTDDKPTVNVNPGSSFTELDTSKIYIFGNGEWYFTQVLPRA